MTQKRVCRTCRKEKPLTEFPLGLSSPDGYASQCKRCKNILARDTRDPNWDAPDTHRWCSYCGRWKTNNKGFGVYAKEADGTVRYNRMCHKCRKVRNVKARTPNRQAVAKTPQLSVTHTAGKAEEREHPSREKRSLFPTPDTVITLSGGTYGEIIEQCVKYGKDRVMRDISVEVDFKLKELIGRAIHDGRGKSS